MKALLNNQKTLLKDNLLYIKEVTVIPAIEFIPMEIPFPQIGLIPGSTLPEYGKGSHIETLAVQVVAYQSILKEEASVMGDVTGKGILDIEDDIDLLLRHELFNNSFYLVTIMEKGAVDLLVAGEDKFMVYKPMLIEYKRHVVDFGGIS